MRNAIKLALEKTFLDIQQLDGGQALRDKYRFGPEAFFRWRLMYHISTIWKGGDILLIPEVRILKKPHDLGIFCKQNKEMKLLMLVELKVTIYNYLFSDQKKNLQRAKEPEVKKDFSKLLKSIQYLANNSVEEALPHFGLIYYLHSEAPITDFMARREFPQQFLEKKPLLSNYFEFIAREQEEPFLYFEN